MPTVKHRKYSQFWLSNLLPPYSRTNDTANAVVGTTVGALVQPLMTMRLGIKRRKMNAKSKDGIEDFRCCHHSRPLASKGMNFLQNTSLTIREAIT
jgi:hypothetical protein